MKRLLYILLPLSLLTAETAFAMNDETASETNFSSEDRIVFNIQNGDENPHLLLNATRALNDGLNDSRIEANQKKVWYNWIVIKTNCMIQANTSRTEDNKFELGNLIASIQRLTPAMQSLPRTTAGLMNLKTTI